MRLFTLLAVSAAIVATPASAWGDRGHRAIADIAWTQMTPAARRGVVELIAGSPALDTPACPVGSLEDASTWADCVRSRYHERFAETASWHYVNISVCAAFQLPDDPEARFVVTRFAREAAVLGDRRNSPAVRLEALLWVTHLTGDLHQPLHVGDAGDRGGNDVEVRSYSGRYPLNLHAEWDRVLVEDAIRAVPGGVAGLAAEASAVQNRQAWRSRSPAEWARESWELARRDAYGVSGSSERCAGGHAPVNVGGDYQVDAIPVVQRQLERAGVRLAGVLNSLF